MNLSDEFKTIARLIAVAHCGIPYCWGGNSPLKGFDCSGLVIYILTQLKVWPIDKDATAQGIYEYYLKRNAGHDTAQVGSLAFFGESTKLITHISFLIDENWQVEAIGDRTVMNLDTAKRYNSGEGAFVRITHTERRRDRVALINLVYPKTYSGI